MGRHLIAIAFLVGFILMVDAEHRPPATGGMLLGYGIAEIGRAYWKRWHGAD